VKRIAKILVPALLMSFALVAPASAEIKIGVVNFGRLLQESPQAKAVFDAIRSEFAPREAELNRQQGTLKGKEERFQKDGATMSEAQRTAAEKELRDGYRDLQRRQQEVQDDFNARRNEEMSKLQRTLLEEVNAFARAQSFDLVLAEGFVFASPTLDITAPVLASLQARKPAAAAPAKPAAK
jgi:outer membrane protein